MSMAPALAAGPQSKRVSGVPHPSAPGSNAFKDPTRTGNWGEPNDNVTGPEWIADWIEGQRALLLAFMEHWRRKAQDARMETQIATYTRTVDAVWATWEPRTDAATGEIYDVGLQNQMRTAMRNAYAPLRGIHLDRDSYTTPDECASHYKIAVACWEDFHYYQNAWNRPRSNDFKDKRGFKSFYNPNSTNSKPAVGKSSSTVEHNALLWREHIIELFNDYRVGVRNSEDSALGPDQLHVFPDTVRHTGHPEKRLPHLVDQFPVSNIRLDEDAIAAKYEQVNNKRNRKMEEDTATADPEKYALADSLPDGHQLYHACTERSFPWQHNEQRVRTSWKTNKWGLAVANKKRKLGGKTTSPKQLFQRMTVRKPVRDFYADFDANDERTRDNLHGGWMGTWDTRSVAITEFELDENDDRIPIASNHYIYAKPTYEPTGTVSTPNEKQFPGRQEFWRERQRDPEKRYWKEYFSDAEDGDPEVGESASGDDSDDEGDLFRISYAQCSGTGCNCKDGKSCGDNCSGHGNGDESGDGRGDSNNTGQSPPPGGNKSPHPSSAGDSDKGGGEDDNDPRGGGTQKSKHDAAARKKANEAARKVTEKERQNAKAAGKDTTTAQSRVHAAQQVVTTQQLRSESKRQQTPAESKASATGGDEHTDSTPKASRSASLLEDRGQPSIQRSRKGTEKFMVDKNDPNWNFVTDTMTLKNGIIYTQRDRVPAFHTNAKPKQNPTFKLYPEHASVPMPTGKAPWKPWTKRKGSNGDEYIQGTLTWKPAGILRKFREDTGEYVEAMRPLVSFEKMLGESLTNKSTIEQYNKATAQRFRRYDGRPSANGMMTRERWKDDEYVQIARAFNEQIERDGLVHWSNHYDVNVKTARERLNAHRLANPGTYPRRERGLESVRSILARKALVKSAVERGRALKGRRRGTVPDVELKPRDMFEVGDFKLEKDSKNQGGDGEEGDGSDEEEKV